MMKRLYIILLLFTVCLVSAFKPESKYLKKAEKSIEKGNLKEARNYYLKALAKRPDSYDANLGMGLMLCELLDNYNDALPYLEKALSLSARDTLKDLAFSLAKCYQHKGEFNKAIQFYDVLNGCIDYDGEIDLAKELQKRKEDCRYALNHRHYPKNTNVFIVNAGRVINSDMPEYVPVLTPQGELIFTSKRKDTKREQLNYLDGKYYESMYISKLDSIGFKAVRRYTLPDRLLLSHFHKYHESIISLSPDGKKLFTYRDNKLFEINIQDRSSYKPRKLLKTINFNYYQNHAYVSRDEKVLYFTSDAAGGYGGNDIYRSVKDAAGQWGKPENLGEIINTAFDEESPFVSEDGLTLYFSSKGHEGYGNFDVYKSSYLDNKWSTPENLGEPINSPGHDIFMITDSASSVGYFSSSRQGGYGDMDIYKIIYLDKINKACPVFNYAPISLNLSNDSASNFRKWVKAGIPDNFKVLSYEWRVNDKLADTSGPVFAHNYTAEGKYTIRSKIVALCDTCLVPVVSCLSVDHEYYAPAAVTETTSPVVSFNLSGHTGPLSNEQLNSLGFDTHPLLFDFNKTDVRDDALSILAPNIVLLKQYPQLSVEIIGHSDSRGPNWANRIVSELRARRVANYLLKNGIQKKQIRAVQGRGADDLVNNCGNGNDCDDNAHQQNRRVVFMVSQYK